MRDRGKLWAVAVTSVMVILAVVYFIIDPMEVRWMPKCIWKVATGTDCPGCGSQRMAHAIMHGDLRSAWQANAYALCMLPLMAMLLWLEIFRARHSRLYRMVHSPAVVGGLAASVLVWWIVRNVI